MTDESLFDRIAKLLPTEQREPFYRRMSHLRKLNPADEILVVCEAMGFLALIIRETPERIAIQRADIERVFEQNIRTIEDTRQSTFDFYRKVQAEIQKLPSEIEGGIDSEKIALRIGEGIRQYFNSTGLPETANGLRAAADNLQAAMKNFSGVAAAFSNPQSGAIVRLNHALAEMEKRLAGTAQHLDTQLRRLTWNMVGGVAVLCFGSLVVGVIIGVLVAHLSH